MRVFKMNKLVRDKVVDNILERGAKVKSRVLNQDEFIEELKIKLKEELDELLEVGRDDKEELVNEISDIQLLIDYLSKVLGVTSSDLNKLQSQKADKAGQFDNRTFIETVSLQDNDEEWIQYYQKKGLEELK